MDLELQVREGFAGVEPAVTVTESKVFDAFANAIVVLADQSVLWRVVRERWTMRIEAAPSFDTEHWFDADLLARLLQRPGYPSDGEPAQQPTIEDLVSRFAELRAGVADLMSEANWPASRARLLKEGRRRDFELFGRPLPPDMRESE